MSKRNGYSLIEIIVVVGIVGLLAGAGIATYNSLNMRSQVEIESRGVVSRLFDWQKNATSGYGAQDCGGGEFGGIQVTIDSVANTITGKAVCGGVPIGSGDTYVIKNGVDLTGGSTFIFSSLSGAANPAISFDLTKSTFHYQVTVTAAGGISASKM